MSDKKYKLSFELSDGTTKDVSFIVPQGEKGDTGNPGVYVGSGDMPEGYSIQIDPEGGTDVVATVKYVNDEVSKLSQEIADFETGATEEQISQINKNTQDIATERARINTFTSLPEGSTICDAELIDARVDFIGVTHENVGEHIRKVTKSIDNRFEWNGTNLVEESRGVLQYGKNFSPSLKGFATNSNKSTAYLYLEAGNYLCTKYTEVIAKQSDGTYRAISSSAKVEASQLYGVTIPSSDFYHVNFNNDVGKIFFEKEDGNSKDSQGYNLNGVQITNKNLQDLLYGTKLEDLVDNAVTEFDFKRMQITSETGVYLRDSRHYVSCEMKYIEKPVRVIPDSTVLMLVLYKADNATNAYTVISWESVSFAFPVVKTGKFAVMFKKADGTMFESMYDLLSHIKCEYVNIPDRGTTGTGFYITDNGLFVEYSPFNKTRLMAQPVKAEKKTRIYSTDNSVRVAVTVWKEDGSAWLKNFDNNLVKDVEKGETYTIQIISTERNITYDDFENLVITEMDDVDNSIDICDLSTIEEVMLPMFNGLKFRQDNESNRVELVDGSTIYAHQGTLLKNGDMCYVICIENSITKKESDENVGVHIIEFDVNTPKNVNDYLVAQKGSYGGITFTGRCSLATGYIKNNKVYAVFYGVTSNGIGLYTRSFDMTTKEMSNISLCSFINNKGEEYSFTMENVNLYLCKPIGVLPLDFEMGFGNFAEYNGEYYGWLISGGVSTFDGVLLKTTDFIHWNYVEIATPRVNTHCEVAIAFSGNYMYSAFRQPYIENRLTLAKYSTSDFKLIEEISVKDCSNRPWFSKDSNGNLSLWHTLSGRNNLARLNVNQTRLMESTQGMFANLWSGCGAMSVVEDGSSVYIVRSTSMNTHSTISISHGNKSYYTRDDVIQKMIEAFNI